jgi:hypothetical protein
VLAGKISIKITTGIDRTSRGFMLIAWDKLPFSRAWQALVDPQPGQ